MNRLQFLGVLLSPVLLLFRRKEDAPKYDGGKLNHFSGTHHPCPECGRPIERGLMGWMRHNDEFHTTHLQWDGNEVTAPEHLNIHMSVTKLKELQASLKKPWYELL